MLIYRSKIFRVNQKVRAADESIIQNFIDYELSHCFGDVIACDFSKSPWRSSVELDLIITDPPYGMRKTTILNLYWQSGFNFEKLLQTYPLPIVSEIDMTVGMNFVRIRKDSKLKSISLRYLMKNKITMFDRGYLIFLDHKLEQRLTYWYSFVLWK